MEGGGQFLCPGPGYRYPQAETPAAAGDAGGDVQASSRYRPVKIAPSVAYIFSTVLVTSR